MNLKSAKVIRIILLAIACIAFVIGLGLSGKAERERKHNLNDIGIEITNCESKYDDRSYYVFFDYTVTNNTAETLDDVTIKTEFKDKSGKTLGILTTEMGSPNGQKMNLEKGGTDVWQTHLEEYQSKSSYDDLFVELFTNGIESLEISYQITYAKWADGIFVRG